MPGLLHLRLLGGREFDMSEETTNLLMIFLAGLLLGITAAVVIVAVFG